MQVHSLFKGHFAFGLLTAFKHAHRIQAKVIQREKKRCRKRTGELKKKKKKLDLRYSWQVMMQIMFRNVVLRVNPSCGGTHAIIPWLNLLYVSNFHCVLFMFLGRLRNALSLLRAGLRERRSEGQPAQGDPGMTSGRPHRARAVKARLVPQHCGVDGAAPVRVLAFVSHLMSIWLLAGNFGDRHLLGGILS